MAGERALHRVGSSPSQETLLHAEGSREAVGLVMKLWWAFRGVGAAVRVLSPVPRPRIVAALGGCLPPGAVSVGISVRNTSGKAMVLDEELERIRLVRQQVVTPQMPSQRRWSREVGEAHCAG